MSAARSSLPVNTYNDGKPYRQPLGRSAPTKALVDNLTPVHSVIQGRPTAHQFVRAIVRELKIRFYSPKTIKKYGNAIAKFLRWFGAPPHRVSREDVRNYLEVLVDGGASSSWVSIHLSAFRTAFDKMCARQVTLGLATPRRPKTLPVVLSEEEVLRLLEAAVSLRDKLLFGLMYAAGLRVGEVTRLRWRDLDFQRRTINVWQGKGRSDRLVMLPASFQPLLERLAAEAAPTDFLFPSEAARYTATKRTSYPKGKQFEKESPVHQGAKRHLSPRTVERAVKTAVQIAGIGKAVTPHSFRHAFATHLLEHGTDVRFIQKFLGHKRLETTRIYTNVAVMRQQQVTSPLDQIYAGQESHSTSPPVGTFQIELTPDTKDSANVRLVIKVSNGQVALDGIVVRQVRPGWVTMDIPPQEDWTRQTERLSDAQRERLHSHEFYERLRNHVIQRFLTFAE